MEEKILGALPNVSLKKGLFKSILYNLVITDKRMIFARFRKELIKEEAKKRAEKLEEEGRGKVRQFFAKLGTGLTFYKRYFDMDPEEILKETEGNFFIVPSNVSKIRLKKGSVSYDEDGNVGYENPHTLFITTSSGEKLKLLFRSDFNSARSLLSQIFGRI